MKKTLIVLSLSLLVIELFAQNDPVPEYLSGNSFPDSVKSLKIRSRDGKALEFRDVLASSRGKMTVVDLWASWCRDCIVGLPEMKKMKKKTRVKEIDFVFISLDEDDQKWKRAIEYYKLPGAHYRIPEGWKNTLSSYIGLDWIPRYFIIDPEGNISYPKATTSKDVKFQQAVLGQ